MIEGKEGENNITRNKCKETKEIKHRQKDGWKVEKEKQEINSARGNMSKLKEEWKRWKSKGRN
jgi:hypothetical protein